MSLKEVLDAAKRSEFYSERMVGGFDDIPILKKEDISKNAPPRSKKMLTGKLKGAYIFSSGGTTSSPVCSIYSCEEFEYSTRVVSRDFSEIIDDSDVVANLFTPGNLWTAYLAIDRALTRVGCTILPLGGNSPYKMIIQSIRDFKGNVIIGCPSTLILLTKYFKDHDIELQTKIEKVIYGGEFLSKNSKDLIREVLDVEDFFSFYGPVESGYVGTQLKDFPPRVHHVDGEYHLVEILDEGLKPVPRGREGSIVITNLNRELMPIIRFDTGDIGRCVGEDRIELLRRAGDRIKAGHCWFSYTTIERAISEFCNPIAVQIVIKQKNGEDHLEVRIETDEEVGNMDEIREGIIRRTRETDDALIGEMPLNLEINVLPIGGIERVKRTGKVRRIIDMREI